MSRTGALALAALAVVLVLVSFWMWEEGPPSVSPRVPAPPVTTVPSAAEGSLDELMLGLRITPLDGAAAKPFALATLGGQRFELAELAGRPALLYFWATW